MERNSDSFQATEDRQKLEQAATGGAHWFYWIAALSLVNSAILFFGGEWSFIVGLGTTQFIDAIAAGAAQELGSDAATVARVVALAGAAFVAGVFAMFGFFAARRHAWAFIVGMVLYTFDGMLFLLVSDWLSVGFHVFALFCIWAGFSAGRKLSGIGMASAPQQHARPDPITP